MLEKLKSLLDESHEQAALALFVTALGLELFAGFDDSATVSILFLSVVTLLGRKRFAGIALPGGTGATGMPSDLAEDAEE